MLFFYKISCSIKLSYILGVYSSFCVLANSSDHSILYNSYHMSTQVKNFLISLSFFATIIFVSCESEDSADVNQDRIYTDYEVFYNSNTDITWVVARFRFGNALGTILELNDPASVSFDGQELPYNQVFAGHYREFAGKIDLGAFTYTDTDGKTFVNEVPAFESIAFPDDLTSLSKSQAYSLEWEGTALSANQQVGLFIGSWVWGEDAAFVQTGEGTNNLVLGINQLENLPTGTSTFYMDRSTAVDVLDGTSAGGRICGKFRASNIQVDITE